jgi:hypothetical protein
MLMKKISNKGSSEFDSMKIFHYAFGVISIVALILAIVALDQVISLKKEVIPETVNVEEFLSKLTAHAEMKGYVGIAPLNIVQVNNNNLGNLQQQIAGIDVSYIGSFIVQYTDAIIIYDFDNDLLRGNVNLQQPRPQLPADFFTKLNTHSELRGLEGQQPIGGQLDEVSLTNLKQQFPDIYSDSEAGDFLLRYETKLIVYDYNADSIVTVVNLDKTN